MYHPNFKMVVEHEFPLHICLFLTSGENTYTTDTFYPVSKVYFGIWKYAPGILYNWNL